MNTLTWCLRVHHTLGGGYSYDDTQSWVRYKDIDDWNKDFLHSTLGKLWKSVKKGGYVLINISDVYSNKNGVPTEVG